MMNDSNGKQFYGFLGMKVYVPDDDPNEEGWSESVLRILRERLKEDQKVRNKSSNNSRRQS